jgi:SAM-dependent methyltransferase
MPTRSSVPRVDTPEWLDQGRGSEADVAANLREMWRINRWLGGLAALTRHLYPRLAAARGGTVLDVGAGAGHVPAAMAAWAARQKLPVRFTALDRSPRHLAGAGPTLGRVCADAARLPLAPASVDFVISSLFLHHLPPAEVVAVLAAAASAARRGVLMSDLVRGRAPLAAFRLIQPVFARHPLTRHDGALSIRRAYTPAELRELAARAGLVRARVFTHWPWRMTLVADHA